MIFLDTETIGLHGPITLLQYAINSDEVILWSPWTEPIQDTLTLIESICQEEIIGFNLAFDWFHICQMYTTFLLLGQKIGFDKIPEDYINEYADLESEARDGPCLKPKSALDLMLFARKGPYQSTMDRKPIRIKRVPSSLALPLANELTKRIELKEIYFARRKNKNAPLWNIIPGKDDFSDIELKFKPSSALKVLAADALNLEPDEILLFTDIEPRYHPIEIGWAPYATAISNKENGWWVDLKVGKKKKSGLTWPGIAKEYILHWSKNELAREYATKDVTLTRDLYKFFGSPECGDNDSILACMVGAVRWRGYAINTEGIKKLRTDAILKSKSFPTAPRAVFKYIVDCLSPTEKAVIEITKSTKRKTLEDISNQKDENNQPTQAAIRALNCLEARKAGKEIELYDKLLQAGRFHASFKIIGTLSTRMSGADGLNPQGIKHDKFVRKQFPLAQLPLSLCGGDFSGFEVSIADAIYDDKELRKQLCTCSKCGYVCTLEEFSESDDCTKCEAKESRLKIHGLLGQALNPGMSYDDIVATKGTADDKYDKGKKAGFAAFYGGDYKTWLNRGLVSDEELAKQAEERFMSRFKGAGEFRKRIYNDFCSMRQEGGIGTQVVWNEPKDYIETVLGFRRYFTLENRICKSLYDLANKPPPQWKAIKIKCTRRDREQTIGGALMSALFAAAFNIQSKALRAAANHVIQSTGASITKELQCRIWTLQPIGINPWIVQPMNIHDEIMCPALENVKDQISKIVKQLVVDFRPIIPLIKIDWSNNLTSWADK